RQEQPANHGRGDGLSGEQSPFCRDRDAVYQSGGAGCSAGAAGNAADRDRPPGAAGRAAEIGHPRGELAKEELRRFARGGLAGPRFANPHTRHTAGQVAASTPSYRFPKPRVSFMIGLIWQLAWLRPLYKGGRGAWTSNVKAWRRRK